jgi:hypothetical protein
MVCDHTLIHGPMMLAFAWLYAHHPGPLPDEIIVVVKSVVVRSVYLLG